MPLYDFACPHCSLIAEVFFKMADKPASLTCPDCAATMTPLPAIGMVIGDEAEWLRSVTEVVDKEGGPHCQRFLADPSRENYRRWMEGEGVRPLEPGEEVRRRPTAADRKARTRRITKDALNQLAADRRITV